MTRRKTHVFACLASWLAIMAIPFPGEAGGVSLYEVSTADLRLASAGWSARADDASTLFTNPAGMTRLCGTQFELGAQPIYAHVNFLQNGSTTISGRSGDADRWIPAGSFFYVHPLTDQVVVGLGSVGYFGSILDYNHDWVGRYYLQTATLQGISLLPTAAYKINDCWSIGAGVNIMYGILKQRSAINNVLEALPDGYFKLRDERFGFGGVFGILWEPHACTRIGLQYLSPVKLKFSDRPHFRDVGPLLNLVLTDLGIIGSTLDLAVKVPQGVMLSGYQELTCAWSIMGNIGWQQWSTLEYATISLADMDNRSFSFTPKYQDTWHVAGGFEWRCCDCWLVSAGVAYDSSAVKTKDRTLNFPIGNQWRFGSGVRWTCCDSLVFDFSTEVQWQGDLDTDVNRGPLAGHVAGQFKNTYGIFTALNLAWRF